MSEKQFSGQFRDAFKGYNKEDVNAYIQQMFHQFEERERSMLRQQKESSSESSSVLTVAAFNEKLQTLKSELEKREKQVAQLQTRIDEMTDHAARYEKMSAQVGDIMLRAQSDADRMVEAAEKKAKQIEDEANAIAGATTAQATAEAQSVRERAGAYAESVRAEALKQADTIISYAADRMKHLYNEETEGYSRILDSLKNQTVHFAEKLGEYRESFPSEVEDAQDIAKEAVRQIASEWVKGE